jgi:hypothetical protein
MEPFTIAFLTLLLFTAFSYSLEAFLYIIERGRPRQRRHVIHVLRIIVTYTITAVSLALAIALPSILIHQLRDVQRLSHTYMDRSFKLWGRFEIPLHSLDDDAGINPDIAGTGVRTAYFMQTLTLLIAEVLAMFHNRKTAVKEIGLSVLLRTSRAPLIRSLVHFTDPA